MGRISMVWALIGAFGGLFVVGPGGASAFCGFYVAGGGAELFNNASQVVLMRDGTRTVLSMQNNYEGPTADFAMVVPVPVVLQKDEVKTLPREIFERVDQLSAPRLVEYWERDPCEPDYLLERSMMKASAAPPGALRRRSAASLGVTIEAKFTVGEYNILILSAKDSTGLETWLKQEKYRIPAGAAELLRPYVQSGMKFFVAKVDASKVKFKNGMAALSPLRFHYDSVDFSLPIRLGMMNSAGKQDLIVHILSPDTRYVVANYDNVSIPTNLDLSEAAKERFGEFYAALFDDTLAKHPGAVVTEYAWNASTCDPCPLPALRPDELQTFGADVLWSAPKPPLQVPAAAPSGQVNGAADPLELVRPQEPRPQPRRMPTGGFVLTRLHARYDKGAIATDLVFERAEPIVGGREFVMDGDKLEEGAVKASMNNFQARYAIRHPWKGPIKCDNPVRNRWGGPPGGQPEPIRPATDLAFAPRGKLKAGKLVRRGRAAPDLLASAKNVSPLPPATVTEPSPTGEPVAEPVVTPPAATAATEAEAPAASQPSAPKEESEDCTVRRVGGGPHATWPLAIAFMLFARCVRGARRRR